VRRPLLVLLTIAVAECATPPVKVAIEEERHNLISPVPVIRTDELRRPLESVHIQLVVAASGEVLRAEALDSSRFADQALTIVKALRFRPFVRNGAAVEVQADEYVQILPPEKVPANHVPFPEVDDLSSVEFSLKRTACFGSCPSYELRITGDGVVTYSGQGWVAVEGKHTEGCRVCCKREQLPSSRCIESDPARPAFVFGRFHGRVASDTALRVIGHFS
jgi:hypothetical protein